MSGRLLLTFLLGGIAALDATPVAQTLLSQPLVTATILGALWGNLALALQVGIVLQILAASTLPVGARTPDDYAVGGVVGAGVALALASQQPFEVSLTQYLIDPLVLSTAASAEASSTSSSTDTSGTTTTGGTTP